MISIYTYAIADTKIIGTHISLFLSISFLNMKRLGNGTELTLILRDKKNQKTNIEKKQREIDQHPLFREYMGWQ